MRFQRVEVMAEALFFSFFLIFHQFSFSVVEVYLPLSGPSIYLF